MTVFGDSGESFTVSSQFHNDHNYESHHTKGEPWNSFMKAAAPTFQKRPHPSPPIKIFLKCN